MVDDHAGAEDDDTEYVTAKAPWLRKIAYLLCQDWHWADDLTQTTIIKLFANWRRARHHANLDAYVRAILVNTFISEQRTHWWKRVTLVNPIAPGNARTADENIGAALEHDLDLGLDPATAMHCSPGTVKSQSHRGLAALRVRLKTGSEAEAEFGTEFGTESGIVPETGPERTRGGPSPIRPPIPVSVPGTPPSSGTGEVSA